MTTIPHTNGLIEDLFTRMETAAGQPASTLEVFVTPLPLPELFAAYEKRQKVLEPYWQAQKDYDAVHPTPDFRKDYAAWSAWYTQKEAEFKTRFVENKVIDSQIMGMIRGAKRQIFDGLASHLRGMMIDMRTRGVLALELQNFQLARQILQQHPDQEMEQRMSVYAAQLHQLTVEGENPFSGKSLLDEVEEFSQKLCNDVLNPLHTVDPSIHFRYDMMNGKMGSFYFMGPKEFFEHFEYHVTPNPPGAKFFYCGRGEEIYYSLGGLLRGNYNLTVHAGREYRDLVYNGNYFHMDLLTPVQLRLEVAESFSKLIEPEFDKIQRDYASLIVPVEKLQPWKSREGGE